MQFHAKKKCIVQKVLCKKTSFSLNPGSIYPGAALEVIVMGVIFLPNYYCKTFKLKQDFLQKLCKGSIF